jgi:hypothetical protein
MIGLNEKSISETQVIGSIRKFTVLILIGQNRMSVRNIDRDKTVCWF